MKKGAIFYGDLGFNQQGWGGFSFGLVFIQDAFFTGTPQKKLKYGKPRLGESTLALIGLDTPNLA